MVIVTSFVCRKCHLTIAFACACFASSTRQRDANAKMACIRFFLPLMSLGDILSLEVCLGALISASLSLNLFCSDQNKLNNKVAIDKFGRSRRFTISNSDAWRHCRRQRLTLLWILPMQSLHLQKGQTPRPCKGVDP